GSARRRTPARSAKDGTAAPAGVVRTRTRNSRSSVPARISSKRGTRDQRGQSGRLGCGRGRGGGQQAQRRDGQGGVPEALRRADEEPGPDEPDGGTGAGGA